MFRAIFDLFRVPKPDRRRFVPSSAELPELWPAGSTVPRLGVLDGTSTEVLTSLCDDYWNSYLDTDNDESLIRDFQVHRRALEIIATRGNEGLTWARERLFHANYDAREESASLIRQLAENDMLGDEREAVARELLTLAVTPPKEDTKEAQAASAALHALSVIGGRTCMAAVREVLTSRDWDDDDNQWECAEILAELTGEPFLNAEDPVAAAKAWLDAHPEDEA